MAGLQFSSGVDKGFEKDLQRMNQKMNGLSSNVKKQGNTINKTFGDIKSTVIDLAAIGGIASLANEMKNLTNETFKYRSEISKLTGLQGQELNTFTANIAASADTFNQDVSEMSLAVTNFAKGMNIDFGQALELVDKGFIDGADGSKEFLAQLREYSPLLKEAGLTADQSIKLMTQQVEQGIYSDKGIDTIKEANLRLRELTPATSDALNAIGLSSTEIQKSLQDGSKTTFDIIQEVSNALSKLPENSSKVGTAIADIFGGPGEDAGLEFIKSLGTISDEFESVTEGLSETQKQEKELLEVNKELRKEFNNLLGDKNPFTELTIAGKEALTFIIQNKEQVLAIAAAVGVWKASIKATSVYNKTFGKEAKLVALQEQRAKQQSIILEIQKQKELIKTSILVAQSAKSEILALNSKIQAQKLALTQAIASKDLTAARTAQQKLANLENQKAAAVIAKKSATEKIANATQKQATLQTNLNTVATQRSTVASRAMSVASAKLGKAFKSLKAAFASNPIGLLVTGLTLAIPLITEFSNKQDDLLKGTTELSKVQATAQKNVVSQEQNLKKLLNTAKDENRSLDERKEAIKELNRINPKYLGDLTLQSVKTGEAEKSVEKYTKALLRNATIQAAQNKIIELRQKQIDNVIGENEIEVGALDKLINGINNFGDASGYLKDQKISLSDEIKKENKILDNQIKSLTKLASLSEEEGLEFNVQQNINLSSDKSGLSDKEIEENQKKALKQLEISNQKEINEITNNYGNKENLEKQFNDRILQQKIEYLTKLKTLTNDQLEKLRIEEDIINLKAQQNVKENNQDELDSLLEQYRSYAQKREDLILTANENIEKLQGIEGSTDAIAEIKKELEDKLSNLDIEFYSEETGLSELFKNDKERSLEEVQELVDGTKKLLSDLSTGTYSGDNYFGLSKELFDQIKDSPEAVEKIQNSFSSLANTSLEETNGKFEQSIELLDNINNLSDQLSDSLGEGTDSATILAKGLLSAASNSVGLIQSIKAVGTASSGLEKASGILALISAAVKVIQSVSNSINSAQKQKVQNYIKELQLINAVNLELINQIALYKEGNEFFATDKWGSALAGLDAYNQALVYQNELISKAAQTDNIRTSFEFKDSIGILPGLSALNERKQQKEILDYANGLTTEVEQALGSVAIRTQERTKVGRFFGAADQYDSLLKLYPKVINNNGEIDSQILKTILDTQDLADADRERLTQVLELTEKAEESYNQFGDYISSIFGGVADEVTSAFQEMYEGGDDAIKNLEGSFSDMIESFTRDAIEFAYLQPLITELNDTTKGLGIDFAKGNISADELQEDIISELGSFYDSLNTLQPSILDAYESADKLAAAAGFDSAFSGETTDKELAQATTSISDSITEQTGTEIKGRMNAIMLSNQIISENSQQMLTYAVQNLVTLNKIKENTDYLPEIARNTKKTADRL